MKPFYYTSLFCCILYCFYSCGYRKNQNDLLLSDVSHIIGEYPDSALILLNSVEDISSLSEEQFAEYALLKIQAKSERSMDISIDTSVFISKEYYQKKKNAQKSAWANFYSGRIFQYRLDYENAAESFFMAEMYADQTSDFYLKGLTEYFIGNLYYDQFLIDEAVEKYKKSIFNFNRSSDLKSYSWNLCAYNAIGNCFLLKDEGAGIDSAFFYYNKGLKLAEFQDDSVNQALIKNNIGIAYMEIGNEDFAKKYLLSAVDLDKQSASYVDLAFLYDSVNMKDSVDYYTDLALQMDEDKENMLWVNTYYTLAEIEENSGNYKKSLEYYKSSFIKLLSVLNEKEKENILKVQKKYELELVRNDYNQLVIEKQRVWLLVSFLAFIVVTVCFYSSRRGIRHRNIILKRDNEKLEAERQIRVLQSMAETFNEKENSMRQEVLRHFHIVKKIALLHEQGLLNGERREDVVILQKVNKIVYGQKDGIDWEILINSINTLHGGVIDRLRQTYNYLDETELKICYLAYAGFTNTEMSTLMNLSTNTIPQRKSNIRKKIGVEEYGDIAEFLIEKLGRVN